MVVSGCRATTCRTRVFAIFLFSCAAAQSSVSVSEPRLLAEDEGTLIRAEVRSAGMTSGNVAEFILNGVPLNASVGRGMNVAVLDMDGRLSAFRVFDTYEDGAPAMVSFLNGVQDGHVVLVAAKDEASRRLSGSAITALQGCGAAKIYALGYQGSYALIGVKGGTALKEVKRWPGAGPAIATATFHPSDMSDRRPVCNRDSPAPPVVGSLSNGQLELQAGCRYRLFEGGNVASCLQGSWFFVAGGSNTMLMTMQLANMLAADAVMPSTDNFTVGGYTLLDVIIKSGQVTYKAIHNFTDCTQKGYPAPCQQQLGAMLARAPAPSGGVRVTQLLAMFWDQVDVGINLIEGDQKWASVDVAFVAQSSDWYLYCFAWKLPYCYRKWMLAKTVSRQQATSDFRGDLQRTMGRLRVLCSPGGRAGKHGCVVPTGAFTQTDASSFQQGVKLYYEDFNNAIREVVAGENKPYLRMLDTWKMGKTMWEEFDHGHGSPLVQLWSIQIIMNGMCQPGDAAKETFAKFEGASCHKYDVRLGGPSSTCPKYRDTCKIRCKTWECMNAVPCKLSAEQPMLVDLRGSCDADVTVEFPSSSGAKVALPSSYPQALPTAVALVLALSLAFLPKLRERCSEYWADSGHESLSESSKGEDSEETPAPKTAGTPICSSDEEGKRRDLRPVVAAGDRMPLGLARFLASMHVVCGHLNAKSPPVLHPGHYFYGWGFTWVPWFFMLSGFVLYTAHARRPKPESALEYAVRRAGNIYPLYAVSLLPAFLFAWIRNGLPSLVVLVAQTWLMQAWNPLWTEEALQTQCWFLSCMVVYWFFFRWFARGVGVLKLRGTICATLVTFALPWLIIIIPALTGSSLTWYKAHSWGESGTWVDFLVAFLKFNPISYTHIFIAGMLLAHLRLLLDTKFVDESDEDDRSCPFFFELLTPIGYLGVGLIFFVPALQPWAAKLSLRLSILMPLQAAIVLGLGGLPSFEAPRVAAFASKLNFLEAYSFACYVFQFICYSMWPETDSVCLPLFYLFLWSVAYLAVNLIQRPLQAWWEQHAAGRWLIPISLSCLWVALYLAPRLGEGPPPELLRLGPEMFDMRLALSDGSGAPSRVLINPSFAVAGGSVLIAARRHGFESSVQRGEHAGVTATILDHRWHSNILVGEVPLNAEAWAAWPTTGVQPFSGAALMPWRGLQNPAGSPWSQLCAKERWIPTNRTLVRNVVTGPEDPKLISIANSTALAFNSLPPLGAEGCSRKEAVSQMYLASDVHLAAGAVPATAEHLQCGSREDPEKNWIPFTYAGKLHFVYSVVPHAVALAGADGSCDVQRSTTNAALRRLQQRGLAIRGSGQAVYVDDVAATPNLPRSHYLALLHVVDPVAHSYANFAYRFGPEPPFPVLQVSSQLPLTPLRAAEHSKVHGQSPFAFGSSLVVQNRTVAIAYGSGDQEARALVMSLGRLDQLFTCDEGKA